MGTRRVIFPILVLLVGLIYFLPHVFSYGLIDPERVYYPLSFAETLYAVQVKEVLEGHFSVGDPQFWEHKYTFPPVFPLLSIWLIALLSLISGSVTQGFLVSDLLFPAVLFLILTGFAYSFLKKKWPAIFIAVVILMFCQLTTKLPSLTGDGWIKFFRQLFLLEVTQPLPFYRTPNPQISFIFLASAIWALCLLWQRFQWKRWCLTLFLGLSLYAVYFYHITYFLGILGVLIGASLLTKRYTQTAALLGLFVLLAVFGIGYFILTGQPQYATLAITGGRFDVRYLDSLFTLRYGFVLLLLYLLRRELSLTLSLFLISLVVSGILVMNFQLFTGWTMQPGHWPQTTIEPLLIIVFGVVFFHSISSIKRKKQIAMWGTLVILVYGAAIQLRFATTHLQDWSIPKDLNKMLEWINEYASPQSVVASLDIATLAYTPILTSSNIFLPIEEYHYATIDEIWERILYAYKLYQIPPEKFVPASLPLVAFFELTYNVNQFKHWSLDEYSPETQTLIKNCYPSLCSGQYALPQSVLEEKIRRYQKIEFKINPYRVDYAIYSDAERNLGGRQPHGELVFTSGKYQVFKLLPADSL